MCTFIEVDKDNWDATNSWSGYNYQGKIALYVVLRKINELISMGKVAEIEKYSFEYGRFNGQHIEYNHDRLWHGSVATIFPQTKDIFGNGQW